MKGYRAAILVAILSLPVWGSAFAHTGPSAEDPPSLHPGVKYDDYGHAIEFTNTQGQTQYVRYDDAGRVISFMDEVGNQIKLDHDEAGRVESYTNPEGGITRTEYDPAGRPTAIRYPDGSLTQYGYQYDEAGRVKSTSKTINNDLIWVENDRFGKPIRVTAPLSNAEWTAVCELFISDEPEPLLDCDPGENPDPEEESGHSFTIGFVSQPDSLPGMDMTLDYYSMEMIRDLLGSNFDLGDSEKFRADRSDLPLVTEPTPLSKEEQDAVLDLLSELSARSNDKVRDANNDVLNGADIRPETVVAPAAGTDDINFERDEVPDQTPTGQTFGFPTEAVGEDVLPWLRLRPDLRDIPVRTDYSYDENNRVKSWTEHYATGASTGNPRQESLQQPDEATLSVSNEPETTEFRLEPRNEGVSPEASQIGVTSATSQINTNYDARGRAISFTPNTHTLSTVSFDELGRVTSAAPLEGMTTILDMQYDQFGRAVEVKGVNERAARHYNWGDDGNLTSMIDPSGGVTEYSYDANDNLIEIRGPDRTVTHMEYNDLNQVISRTELVTTELLPILVGARKDVGTESAVNNAIEGAVKGAAGKVIGRLLGGKKRSVIRGGGGSKPKTKKDPTRKGNVDEIRLTDAATGVAIWVRPRWTKKGDLLISTHIVDSPDKGTFQAIFLEDENGRQMGPAKIEIYKIWRKHTLTVSWTRSTYVDGALVSRTSGGWSESWTEDLGFFQRTSSGEEGAGPPPLWRMAGFDRAHAGARRMGTYFAITLEQLQDMGTVRLVVHITRPSQDPVMTVPFAFNIVQGVSGVPNITPIQNNLHGMPNP